MKSSTTYTIAAISAPARITPLRRVLAVIDFTFERAEVARFYGRNGNEVGTVMPAGPRQQFSAANADAPNAIITTVDLRLWGPMVVEVPLGPFIGFVDDHNMRWALNIGTKCHP